MTPDRVFMMRQVRRMLRQGRTHAEIIADLGVNGQDVTAQRRLMSIARGETIDARRRSVSGLWRTTLNKAAAETTGDLCDIIAAPPSRRDLRFWGEA